MTEEGNVNEMLDTSFEVEEEATQLLQHFQAHQDEDGNTILLTHQQLESYDEEGVLEQHEHSEGIMIEQDIEQDQEVDHVAGVEIVDELLEEDDDLMDNHILHQESHPSHLHHTVTPPDLEQLITLHAVDSDGNIMEENSQDHPHDLAQEIQIGNDVDDTMDDGSILMETETIEEVITSTPSIQDVEAYEEFGETNSDITHQFLSVQDSVFNPITGILQPITSSITSTTSTTSIQSKPKRSKQQIKYVIANSEIDGGDGNQILLDATQLEGLLDTTNTIQTNNRLTLSATTGKNIILTSPGRIGSGSRIVKAPTKILPAPIPSGDQQQGPLEQRLLLKQGNLLTPISSIGSTSKLIKIPTGTGNQIQYLRMIPNDAQISQTENVSITPTKTKLIMPKLSSPQKLLISNVDGNENPNNVLILSNCLIKSEQGSSPVGIRGGSSYDPILSSSSTTTMTAEQALFALQQSLGTHPNQIGFESFRSLLEPNGMRPRKPCNCTKSQCLKLYCDCFANGEFCHLCNCTNCFNNLTHEEERQKAIKLVLERNPGAFRPKIGKSSQTGEAHERRHSKGCNCRRSGCLKNYCECYEAKIFCSGICKCSSCKNCIENIPSGLPNGVGVEQHFAGAGTSHRQTLKDLAEAAEVRVQQQNQVRNKMKAQWQDVSSQNNIGCTVPPVVFGYPQNSISFELITSTVDLLLARAEVGEKQNVSEGELERVLIEEFGECLNALMELGITPGEETD